MLIYDSSDRAYRYYGDHRILQLGYFPTRKMLKLDCAHIIPKKQMTRFVGPVVVVKHVQDSFVGIRSLCATPNNIIYYAYLAGGNAKTSV